MLFCNVSNRGIQSKAEIHDRDRANLLSIMPIAYKSNLIFMCIPICRHISPSLSLRSFVYLFVYLSLSLSLSLPLCLSVSLYSYVSILLFEHFIVLIVCYFCYERRYYLNFAESRGRIGSVASKQCLHQLYIRKELR